MADMKEMFTTLFTAPIRAAVEAEASYRRIWVEWLQQTASLIPEDATDEVQARIIANRLDMAPVMKLDAAIDVGLTMRLVTVKQTDAGGELGLAVGPFQVSGQFGFSSSKTAESVMEARARYQLSNTNSATMRDYLEAADAVPTKKTELENAQKALQAS